MKKLLLFFCIIFSFSSLMAQETYTVNDETVTLKTAVDGSLDLLWNITNRKYRYFIRTSDNTFTELLNSTDTSADYKTTLEKATSGMSADGVELTLPSLMTFLQTYNKTQDPNYIPVPLKSKLQLRVSVFGGISNSPFVDNPKNIKTPVFGAELEFLENKESPRHSGFLQLRHVLDKKNEFSYSTTEFSLGYRFRFIKSKIFNPFADVKVATINFSKARVPVVGNGDVVTIEEVSNTAFDAPFIFGIGADIRISDSSFITLGYNQLFALFLNNQGNFSTDVTLGYKMKL